MFRLSACVALTSSLFAAAALPVLEEHMRQFIATEIAAGAATAKQP
jgi:hypothetical protein